MATNYAVKYSNIVDEKFSQASLTENVFSTEYDFNGANSITVYSIATAPMNDYVMTGDKRYGTPGELSDTTQTLMLTKDRSFTFTVDRRNYEDTPMVKEVGRALSRQISEVVIPEIDSYRLDTASKGAGKIVSGNITASNAYNTFLTGVTTVLDSKVPLIGTFAFIGTNFYKNIRLDGAFIKAADISQNLLINGQIGTIENIPLIYVPTSCMPANVEFLIINKDALIAPKKLSEYRIHDNPPGINGWLVEGRVYYDAFVLANKKSAIYVHKSA